MIKDPLNTAETPYDLLDLDPGASHSEVHQALPRFMRNRKNLPRLGKANDAVRKLRDPKERLEIDFFYYTIGNMSEEEVQEVKELDSLLPENISVPTLSVKDFYSDLEKENYDDEFTEFVIEEKKVVETEKYSDLNSIRLESDFDL